MDKSNRIYIKKLSITVAIILLAGFLAKPIYYAVIFAMATSDFTTQQLLTTLPHKSKNYNATSIENQSTSQKVNVEKNTNSESI